MVIFISAALDRTVVTPSYFSDKAKSTNRTIFIQAFIPQMSVLSYVSEKQFKEPQGE